MKKFYIRYIFSICLFPCLFSCASPSKSALTGGAVGAGVGGTVGAVADPGPEGKNRVRNVLIGGAVGGALGVGSGLLVDSYLKSQQQSFYEKGRSDSQKETSNVYGTSSNQPMLIPPKTEAKWIPDQVRGSTFIPGHFEYVIIGGAKWETAK